MVYVVILVLLFIAVAFHLVVFGILQKYNKKENYQFMIAVVLLCYAVITLARRILPSRLSPTAVSITSYLFVSIAVVVSIAYIKMLLKDKIFNIFCNVFYAVVAVLCASCIVINCFHEISFYFYLLIVGFSAISLTIGIIFIIKDFKQIALLNKILLLSVFLLIFSFVSISICNLYNFEKVYYHAIVGFTVYFALVEIVTILNIIDIIKTKSAVYDTDSVDSQPKDPEERNNSEGIESLTKTELSVYELLKSDFSVKEIAMKLCCSVNTVKTHKKHIYSKLRIHKYTDLINNKTGS